MQRAWAISYCHLCLICLHHIFRHYLINVTIFGKKLLNIKYVFWFSLQVLSKAFLILRRIQRDIIIKVKTSSCKVPVVLEFSQQIFEKKIIYHVLSKPVQCQQRCRLRTDGHEVANSCFLLFCKRAWLLLYSLSYQPLAQTISLAKVSQWTQHIAGTLAATFIPRGPRFSLRVVHGSTSYPTILEPPQISGASWVTCSKFHIEDLQTGHHHPKFAQLGFMADYVTFSSVVQLCNKCLKLYG